MRHLLRFVLLAAVGGGLASADLREYRPESEVRGSLHSVGSDTMDVITFGWIQLFRKFHPQARVTIEARSSASGPVALTSGAADVAPVARELLPAEIRAFEQRHGYPPLVIRVATGSFAADERTHALAVFVHRDNPVRRLTLAHLDAIFSSTRRRGHPEAIIKWGQLGATGEWAERPVTIYGLRRPNGIANFFQLEVLAGGDFRTEVHERSNSHDQGALAAVAASVAADPGGIGYASFANAGPALRALALARTADGPFVDGTPETVRDRTYPLTRSVYIVVNRPTGQPLAPHIREFLRLVLSCQGQKVVADNGVFLPLPESVVNDELAKLE